MAFLQDIASELAASVVGALLLWVGAKYLRPWIRELTWRGTHISGDWLSYDEDPATHEPVGRATIAQRGSYVTMRLTRFKNRYGEPTNRAFTYQGRFSSREMTLLFEAIDRPDYILGAIVLHLDNAAKLFKGCTTYHDETQASVVSLPFWLRRA